MISNYIQYNLKADANFSYGDLYNWIQENNQIPDDDHQPFVIDSFIRVNEMIQSTSIARVAISTKYLLSLVQKRKHICADTTYKLNWHGNTDYSLVNNFLLF